MPRFVRIPVFDFVDDGPEESPPLSLSSPCPSASGAAAPPANPSLEEFFAAYNVARCVWFRRRRRTSLESEGGETRKRAGKRRRMDPAATIVSSPSSSPPTTTAAATAEPKDAPARAPPWFLGPIREAYESASPLDKASWNVESGGGERRRKAKVSPSDLWGEASGNGYGYGYASFVLSEGATGPGLSEELAGLLGGGSHRLPHRLLWSNASPRGGAFPSVWVAPHCWVFCARNKGESKGSQGGSGPSRAVLSGRPEHTDAISHDGTVHWQLGGTKTWKLRPTLELMERTKGNHHRDRGGNGIDNGIDNDNGDEKNGDGIALSDSYTVCLEEGDFLVVDTRLWWHSTLIPPQLESSGFYSVSVARDLCLVDSGGSSPSRGSSNDRTQNQPFAPCHSEGCSVFNAEASWASGFLPSGSILLVDTVARATCGLEEPGGAFPEAYYDALPPTILRTGSGEEANCRLVVRWAVCSDDEDSDEDRGEPPPPSMVDVGLETMRDIREGDDFVVLQPP